MNGRSRHLPADERRAATVEAVVGLAAEQNPSDITTTAIAQRKGLTQGAPFRHFPTKTATLLAVMSWVTERLNGFMEHVEDAPTLTDTAADTSYMSETLFIIDHTAVSQ